MQNTLILKPNEWMWKTIDPNSKEKLIKSLVQPSVVMNLEKLGMFLLRVV